MSEQIDEKSEEKIKGKVFNRVNETVKNLPTCFSFTSELYTHLNN